MINVVNNDRTNVTVTEIGVDFDGAPEQVSNLFIMMEKGEFQYQKKSSIDSSTGKYPEIYI